MTTKDWKEDEKCEACGDKGWLISYNTERKKKEVQRCDLCQKFEGDIEAYKAFLKTTKRKDAKNLKPTKDYEYGK